MARATRQDKVRELQRTLYRAAKADPKRRFHALHDKVYRSDVLERAWELVRANRGAAGIDKQTIAEVEEHGVAELLDELVRAGADHVAERPQLVGAAAFCRPDHRAECLGVRVRVS